LLSISMGVEQLLDFLGHSTYMKTFLQVTWKILLYIYNKSSHEQYRYAKILIKKMRRKTTKGKTFQAANTYKKACLTKSKHSLLTGKPWYRFWFNFQKQWVPNYQLTNYRYSFSCTYGGCSTVGTICGRSTGKFLAKARYFHGSILLRALKSKITAVQTYVSEK
jgi:hypothetical protein